MVEKRRFRAKMSKKVEKVEKRPNDVVRRAATSARKRPKNVRKTVGVTNEKSQKRPKTAKNDVLARDQEFWQSPPRGASTKPDFGKVHLEGRPLKWIFSKSTERKSH